MGWELASSAALPPAHLPPPPAAAPGEAVGCGPRLVCPVPCLHTHCGWAPCPAPAPHTHPAHPRATGMLSSGTTRGMLSSGTTRGMLSPGAIVGMLSPGTTAEVLSSGTTVGMFRHPDHQNQDPSQGTHPPRSIAQHHVLGRSPKPGSRSHRAREASGRWAGGAMGSPGSSWR